MSWRTTLVLCLAAVLSAWAAFRLHERAPREVGGVATVVIAADDLPVESVRSIRIHRPPLATLVVERRGAAWVETKPFDVPVNPFQVRETILAARQLRATRRTDAARLESDGASLESLSLRPPLATVTFTTDDGRELPIRLGRLGVAGRAFVQVGDDDAVLVVGQELHQRLLGDSLRAWRERTLFPEASVDALEIGLRAGDSATTLVRQGRAWRMREPVDTRADAAAVNALVQSLARAEADAFVAENPDDLRPFGLHAPVGAATLRWRLPGATEPTVRTLLVGGALTPGGTDRYAMVEGRPLVMRVSGTTLGAIFRGSPAFVEPTAAPGEPSDVRAVEIVRGAADSTPTRLERVADHWRRDGVALSNAEVRRVDHLLEQLLGARATAISLQAYPDALHLATVVLVGFDDEPLATVRIAVDDGAGQWATEADDGVLRIYPLSQLPELALPVAAPGQ